MTADAHGAKPARAHPVRTSTTIWIDGGARGNPGEAGCGVVIDLAGHTREQHYVYLGRRTNNVAEYAGLLVALQRARELRATHLRVISDSLLLVEQMTGGYRVKARHLQPLWLRAQQLARGFSECRFEHTARAGNREADGLANRAIESRASTLPRPEGLP